MCRNLSALKVELGLSPSSPTEQILESSDFPQGLVLFEGDAKDPTCVENALQCYVEVSQLPLQGFAHFPGSVFLKPAHMTKLEEWTEVLNTNLTSAFIGLKAVLVPLRKQGFGNLVFLSSVAAHRGLPNHEAISAAKAGLEGLVRSAAATYPQLRINAVSPGLIDAAATQKIVTSEKALAASVSLNAIKRAGTGDEIASAVEFLLGPGSSYVTGQVLCVDGGMSSLGFPK